MPVYEYKCLLCGETSDETVHDLASPPCANESCEGTMRRCWSFRINAVPGAGGSPGHSVG